MEVSPPLTPKKIASARPRSRIGNASTTIASAAGIMIAPDTPCRTRNVMIQVSAAPPFGVAPHSAEEPANPTMPISTMRFAPSTSASRPPSAKVAASARR